MKKWCRSSVVSLLALGILVSGAAVQAANTKTVITEIPGFKVYLNGMRIYSPASPYPILFYKDITYFPLTWD